MDRMERARVVGVASHRKAKKRSEVPMEHNMGMMSWHIQ